jgi:hypothetical protein
VPVRLPSDLQAQGRIPETTLQCIRHLRNVSPRCTISVEVEKPNREGLVELAAEADVVFYSRSWAEVSRPEPDNCGTLGLQPDPAGPYLAPPR